MLKCIVWVVDIAFWKACGDPDITDPYDSSMSVVSLPKPQKRFSWSLHNILAIYKQVVLYTPLKMLSFCI